ncbi:MAG: DUF541 domain-containing protein [Bacteroidetes bacterium]|nr:DUF541 domain-containing protein [Bacteroidota bacterium]
MKYSIRILLFSLFFGLMFNSGRAQIRIQNYKYNEINNWQAQVQLNHQQMQLLQAGVGSMDEFTMEVKVLMNVEATRFNAVFSVQQVAETALDVNTLLNERINAFKEQLKSLGIKDKDFVVDLISQVPIYGIETEKKLFSKNQNEVPLGFELHKIITITYNSYNLLNDIVFEASKNEIYDLVKVDYFAASPENYFDTMRHAGLAYLDAIFKKYKKAGFELDSFDKMMAENSGTIYPISRYRQYTGVSRLSYDKLLKKSGNEIVMNPIVAPTLYYDFLPFTDFDIVINSAVNKPNIQYTFDIKVKYVRNKKPEVRIEKKVEKQFYMITPDGSVKLLDLR